VKDILLLRVVNDLICLELYAGFQTWVGSPRLACHDLSFVVQFRKVIAYLSHNPLPHRDIAVHHR
jgi:hypothetical protein